MTAINSIVNDFVFNFSIRMLSEFSTKLTNYCNPDNKTNKFVTAIKRFCIKNVVTQFVLFWILNFGFWIVKDISVNALNALSVAIII
ncbi:hypothetical protein A6770_04260 [Nostoc minutum NIES-26]|uniref:Uncharacterized protein n=1 Tax=Nostoc minutum NIES-26 TaxID=1844469 RepID=A0A367QCS2_9NOSO|nr:hypothetical protein A6770_04260 [Nostoc minutum NIES-26]